MRKMVWVAFALLLFASTALAQNRIDTKWRCPKPSEFHSVAVGDAPNHNYTIIQGSCKSTASDAGFPEDESDFTEFQEMLNASVSVHGRMNVTMTNGDKVYYSYEGSFSTDITKPFSQRWNLESGTGRYKFIKGNGACSGMVHADGTGDMECTGTFSIGKSSGN
ncbi:MAG TPA: hypothetical protein VGE83_12205 [Terracidiphilus sp.]|jgi:hypothetical protein